MNKKDKNAIELFYRCAYEITERTEHYLAQGRDRNDVFWQTTFEFIYLMWKHGMIGNDGQVIPGELANDDEEYFFIKCLKKIDLPPEVSALVLTPTAFKRMGKDTPEEIKEEYKYFSALDRNAYNIIITCNERSNLIMSAAFPGIKGPGIDVFKDGRHAADYSYKTIDKCLNDLSRVIWTYFRPDKNLSYEDIIRYTENWYLKEHDIDEIQECLFHDEFSYLHHPELIGLSQLEAAFKLIEARMVRQHADLKKFIKYVNEVLQDGEEPFPIVTIAGIRDGKYDECWALLVEIIYQIDVHFLTFKTYLRIKFPEQRKDNELHELYDTLFSKTLLSIFKKITGRDFPGELPPVY